MPSNLSPSPCACSHPHSPACGIVPGIPHQHSKASLASAHKGTLATPRQLLGTLHSRALCTRKAQGVPGRFLQPSEGIWLLFRDSQHHNLSILPHPHPVWWHLVRVVAALGASTRNSHPFLSPNQSQSPLVPPVQCVNVPICHHRIF